MPNRDYTYEARIESVSAAGGGYNAKGDDEETQRLTVTVKYAGGTNDSFSVGGDHRDEFIVGRKVNIILRVLDVVDA